MTAPRCRFAAPAFRRPAPDRSRRHALRTVRTAVAEPCRSAARGQRFRPRLAGPGGRHRLHHTGRDAAPLQVRYETGSYGYRKRQISSGQVLGDLDYYVSLTDSDYDGYQDHTQGSRSLPALSRDRQRTGRAGDPGPDQAPSALGQPALCQPRRKPSATGQHLVGQQEAARPRCTWTTTRSLRWGWSITTTRWTCAKAPTASRWPTPMSAVL